MDDSSKKKISVEGYVPEVNDGGSISPKQSAASLFRYFMKLEFLIDSLKKRALVPRYYPEDVSYLDIGFSQIAYPMVCFCDLNLHRIEDHSNFYGKYGVAFEKKWGEGKGVQPIQYINPDSILRNDLREAFLYSIDRNPEQSESSEDIETPPENYLLSHMMFIKPLHGTMERNGIQEIRNFTDEREWRYVPDVSVENLPAVIVDREMFSRETLNAAIAIKESCWLKFEYSDIKYIIVDTREDASLLIDFLLDLPVETNEKHVLLTKIVVLDEMKGDF